MKTLSFCITCKNRLQQLSNTLPKNLEDNRRLKRRIEFVLVDFGSTDGLSSWVKDEFGLQLSEGYLKYYYTEKMENWHMSIAKNTAHLLSTGKFVTNLDCDNFTGENGAGFIVDVLQSHKSPIMLHQFSGHWGDGSCGRISLRKEIFSAIGGYDEQFQPAGFQDLDLLARLWTIGVKYLCVGDDKYNRSIPNTKAESIAFCNSKNTYEQMNMNNRKRSFENICKTRNPLRNNGIFGIRDGLFDHNQRKVVPVVTQLDYRDLVRTLKLSPPDDISYLLNSVFPKQQSRPVPLR